MALTDKNIDILIELFETRELKNYYVRVQRWLLAAETKDRELEIARKLDLDNWYSLNEFNKKLSEYLELNGVKVTDDLKSTIRELKLSKLGI